MNQELLTPVEDDIPIEPDADVPIEIEPELEIEIELETEPAVLLPAAAMSEAEPARLMELLPPDFRLPALIKFIPNQALRVASENAAASALAVVVEGPEGLQRADLAVAACRASLKGIDEHLEDPIAIANELHKRLTGIRGEWKATGTAAVATVGSRIFAEQRRLEQLAAAERRRLQDEADSLAREHARRESEAAVQANAPAPVVEELKRQAETATAPPVHVPALAPAPLANSTTVKTWKGRIVGTPGSDEANPTMAELSTAQRQTILGAMKDVVEGRAPMAVFEINWSYVNNRAKADKSTLNIPGFEAIEIGSVRAKSTRGSR